MVTYHENMWAVYLFIELNKDYGVGQSKCLSN